jgi:hypothetical protein
MNYKGQGRKPSCPNQHNILAFAWRDLSKITRILRIVGVPVGI